MFDSSDGLGVTTELRTPPGVFAEWLEADRSLTPTELRIVRALASRFGTWLPAVAIVRAVYRDTHHGDLVQYEIRSMRMHLVRIRRKLAGTPWRIENRHQHGLYRLTLGR